MLRDVIRQFSNGCGQEAGRRVGVVDERSEIAACYRGIPQNDLGIRTDVLDAAPNIWVCKMMLRSMTPEILAVDEIGSRTDKEAIDAVMNAVVVCWHGTWRFDGKNADAAGPSADG